MEFWGSASAPTKTEPLIVVARMNEWRVKTDA
jgi:hypothetical protein